MLNIAALQSIAPQVDFGFAPASAAGKATEPRNVLAANIDESIALIANPAHQVIRRGKPVNPAACFTINANSGIATIVLRYSHKALVLSGAGNTTLENVPVAALPAVLAAIKQQVLAGAFDDELAKIKQGRVAAQKHGLQAAAAKKSPDQIKRLSRENGQPLAPTSIPPNVASAQAAA